MGITAAALIRSDFRMLHPKGIVNEVCSRSRGNDRHDRRNRRLRSSHRRASFVGSYAARVRSFNPRYSADQRGRLMTALRAAWRGLVWLLDRWINSQTICHNGVCSDIYGLVSWADQPAPVAASDEHKACAVWHDGHWIAVSCDPATARAELAQHISEHTTDVGSPFMASYGRNA